VEINFPFFEDGSTHGVSILRREIVILALDRWGNQGESEVDEKNPTDLLSRLGLQEKMKSQYMDSHRSATLVQDS